MKKLFSSLIACALIMSPAYLFAQVSSDPSVRAGQIVVPVYNDGTSAIAAGNVVVWDTTSTAADVDAAIVATTTTADTNIVAGVIWPAAIPAGGEGSMVIWGWAKCDVVAAVPKGSPLCTSTTAGSGGYCADNDGAYAFLTENAATNDEFNCIVK